MLVKYYFLEHFRKNSTHICTYEYATSYQLINRGGELVPCLNNTLLHGLSRLFIFHTNAVNFVIFHVITLLWNCSKITRVQVQSHRSYCCLKRYSLPSIFKICWLQISVFAWEAYEKGAEVHIQADPTKLDILTKEYQRKKEDYKSGLKEGILAKYGGEEHLEAPPKQLLMAQSVSLSVLIDSCRFSIYLNLSFKKKIILVTRKFVNLALLQCKIFGPKVQCVSWNLSFKTTCNIRPHFKVPLVVLK